MKNRLTQWGISLAGITALMASAVGERSASAQTIPPWQKLVAADATVGDQFGTSVAIRGDRAIVGAPEAFPMFAQDAGQAYVLERTSGTWTQSAKLIASDAASGFGFGTSVAIDGATVVVGAPYADGWPGGKGAVYVFELSGSVWMQTAKLIGSDLAAGDNFGESVDIDGDTIVVGAPIHDAGMGASKGAAYVFRRTGPGWTQEAKLVPALAMPNAMTGSSVSISGNTIALGAPGFFVSGVAWIFVRSGTTWTHTATLGSPTPSQMDDFGASVDVEGSTLLAGAPIGPMGGGCYVFALTGSTWALQQVLTSPGSTPLFGRAVSLDGSVAVVGDPWAAPSGFAGSGAGYVYRRSGSTWSQVATLQAGDQAQGDALGSAVAADDGKILIGSPGNDAAVADGGAIYAFGSFGLSTGIGSVSMSGGGGVVFTLIGEPGTAYLLGGSLSGTSPGYQLSSDVTVPLNMDPLLASFIVGDAASYFPGGYSGTFDASGVATITMVVPPNKLTLPSGTNIDFAFAAFGVAPTLITIDGASNPVSVKLVD